MRRSREHLSENCRAVSQVLSRVGDKWSVLVVSILGRGPMRFNELKRTVSGISQRMLTLTLRTLERDGLVTRTVYPTVPPHVEYELTALGQSLLSPVSALAAWAIDHRNDIAAAQRKFDAKAESESAAPSTTTRRAAPHTSSSPRP